MLPDKGEEERDDRSSEDEMESGVDFSRSPGGRRAAQMRFNLVPAAASVFSPQRLCFLSLPSQHRQHHDLNTKKKCFVFFYASLLSPST